jgi:hypothetical protein
MSSDSRLANTLFLDPGCCLRIFHAIFQQRKKNVAAAAEPLYATQLKERLVILPSLVVSIYWTHGQLTVKYNQNKNGRQRRAS